MSTQCCVQFRKIKDTSNIGRSTASSPGLRLQETVVLLRMRSSPFHPSPIFLPPTQATCSPFGTMQTPAIVESSTELGTVPIDEAPTSRTKMSGESTRGCFLHPDQHCMGGQRDAKIAQRNSGVGVSKSGV